MQRSPRKLNYLKCDRCRKDRQKCTPVDRDWPGRRCDRCIKFEYPCSESVTAQGALRRDPDISRAKQPMRPSEHTGKCSNYNPGPIHDSGYPTVGDTTGWEPLSAPPYPANSSTGVQPIPRCAELFGLINKPLWSYKFHPDSFTTKPDLKDCVNIIVDELLMELNLVTYGSYHRECLIKTNYLHQKRIEKNIADGIPQNKSMGLAATQIIEKFIEMQQTGGAIKSPTDLIIYAAQKLREGKRWQELIDVVGSQEILLIGRNKIDDDYDDHKTSPYTLEKRFYENYNSMNIEEITKSGSDEVFAKMKELMLTPNLQLKETCQRLSGVFHMICRFREEFGLSQPKDKDGNSIFPGPSGTDCEKDDKDFNLISSLGSEIKRRIIEVLGEPTPRANDEDTSSDDEDTSSDNEDTSSDDDDLEETSGSAQGDRDRDFDNDFCINFRNNAAFASADWI